MSGCQASPETNLDKHFTLIHSLILFCFIPFGAEQNKMNSFKRYANALNMRRTFKGIVVILCHSKVVTLQKGKVINKAGNFSGDSISISA